MEKQGVVIDIKKNNLDMDFFFTPEELIFSYEAQRDDIKISELIRKPEYKCLKEMYCASLFGLGYKKYVAPCFIRINMEENSDTDFFLKTKASLFSFQTTISDVPTRRMGDDYKTVRTIHVPEEDEEKCRIEGPKWIANTIGDKAKKRYSAAHDLNLLVYVNFKSDGLDYQTICNQVHEYMSEFSSIWIITWHQICSIKTNLLLGQITYFAELYDFDK